MKSLKKIYSNVIDHPLIEAYVTKNYIKSAEVFGIHEEIRSAIQKELPAILETAKENWANETGLSKEEISRINWDTQDNDLPPGFLKFFENSYTKLLTTQGEQLYNIANNTCKTTLERLTREVYVRAPERFSIQYDQIVVSNNTTFSPLGVTYDQRQRVVLEATVRTINDRLFVAERKISDHQVLESVVRKNYDVQLLIKNELDKMRTDLDETRRLFSRSLTALQRNVVNNHVNSNNNDNDSSNWGFFNFFTNKIYSALNYIGSFFWKTEVLAETTARRVVDNSNVEGEILLRLSEHANFADEINDLLTTIDVQLESNNTIQPSLDSINDVEITPISPLLTLTSFVITHRYWILLDIKRTCFKIETIITKLLKKKKEITYKKITK